MATFELKREKMALETRSCVTEAMWGPPGSGKSSRLRDEIVAALSRKNAISVMAFSEAAAKELGGRIRTAIGTDLHQSSCATLHSLAMRSVKGHRLAQEASRIDQWNRLNPHYAMSGRYRLNDPDDAAPMAYSDMEDGHALLSALNYYRNAMVPSDRWDPAVRAFHEEWTVFKADHNLLDFCDYIESAIGTKPPCTAREIFFDEAQDATPLEWALVNSWGQQAERLVVAGDPYQCIYEWRGADPLIFQNMPDKVFLPRSYRLPQAIWSYAYEWARRLSSFEEVRCEPARHAGFVDYCPLTYEDGNGILALARRYMDQNQTVLVMASCGYMLSSFLEACKAQEIAVCNPWRPGRTAWNTGKSKLMVGTCHSAKGGEADVVILFPNISSAATDYAHEYGTDAIVRTFFVGMTRARHGLYLCQSCGEDSVSW